MTSAQHADDQDELARSLKALREAAGMTQVPAAKAAGISQTRLSRAERDERPRVVLKPDVVRRLCRIYGADLDETARLVLLASQVDGSFTSTRVIFQHGTHHWQERLRLIEERAVEVRSFAPTAVFGVLQTAAYAGVVFGERSPEGDAAKAVAKRIERHDQLADLSRQWVLIQTQGALRWGLGTAGLMAEQMTELVDATKRPNVRLGIIPDQTISRILPMHGFHLFRSDPGGWTVYLGSREGTALMTDEQHIADYQALFAELEGLAVFDDDARTLLARVATDYRKDAGS